MKKGYRLEIQKDLSDFELEIAKQECKFFKKMVQQNNGMWNNVSRGGWKHGKPLARNEHGSLIYVTHVRSGSAIETDLVFRRLSKTKRIFGVVKRNLLVSKEDGKRGKEIKNSSCSCRECLGGTKVKMDPVETFTYYEEGEIKG